MKVILKQTVPKLGKEGQVVNVKDGFARNFLFPKGMALVADKKQVAAQERRIAKLAALAAETKTDAQKVQENLDGKGIEIETSAGAVGGKLFGAITKQNIVDAIKEQLGVEVETRMIGLLHPIKRLGRYKIEIDLHREVDATIDLRIFDPEHPDEEEAKSLEAAQKAMEEQIAEVEAEEAPVEADKTEESEAPTEA